MYLWMLNLEVIHTVDIDCRSEPDLPWWMSALSSSCCYVVTFCTFLCYVLVFHVLINV